MNDHRLVNETVVLRRFRQADAAMVERLAGDPAVADTTLNIPHPYPEGEARRWIATHNEQFERASGAVFAITARPDLALVGCISIRVDRRHQHGEVGYWIGRAYWGRGDCTAALRLLLRYGFSELELHRVCAHHIARNPASGRVMEKAGMRREGMLREHVLKSDRYEDVVLYGLLRSEYLDS